MSFIEAIALILMIIIILAGIYVVFAENFIIALLGIGGSIAFIIFLAKKSGFL